jgi:hypothetical protein
MCCNHANRRVEFEDVWLIKPMVITKNEIKVCLLTMAILQPLKHPKILKQSENPCLVVRAEGSHPRGFGFKSRYILDGCK